MGFAGGDANEYRYVEDSPLGSVDRTGLQAQTSQPRRDSNNMITYQIQDYNDDLALLYKIYDGKYNNLNSRAIALQRTIQQREQLLWQSDMMLVKAYFNFLIFRYYRAQSDHSDRDIYMAFLNVVNIQERIGQLQLEISQAKDKLDRLRQQAHIIAQEYRQKASQDTSALKSSIDQVAGSNAGSRMEIPSEEDSNVVNSMNRWRQMQQQLQQYFDNYQRELEQQSQQNQQ